MTDAQTLAAVGPRLIAAAAFPVTRLIGVTVVTVRAGSVPKAYSVLPSG